MTAGSILFWAIFALMAAMSGSLDTVICAMLLGAGAYVFIRYQINQPVEQIYKQAIIKKKNEVVAIKDKARRRIAEGQLKEELARIEKIRETDVAARKLVAKSMGIGVALYPLAGIASIVALSHIAYKRHKK